MGLPQQQSLLLVEGDQDSRTTFFDILTAAGYHLDMAADAEDALSKCKSKKYILILVDLVIPGECNGTSLIEKIRRIQDKVSIIAFLGHGGKNLTATALKAGADRFVAKEVLLVDIFKIIATISTGNKQTRAELIPPAPQPLATKSVLLVRESAPFIFANMPNDAVQTLINLVPKKELIKGQELILDTSREMMIMISGEADLWYKKSCVGSVQKNESIGEACVFIHNQTKLVFTLIAKTGCSFRLFDKNVLKKYFKEHDKSQTLRFAANIIFSLSDRMLRCLDANTPQQENDDKIIVQVESIQNLEMIVN